MRDGHREKEAEAKRRAARMAHAGGHITSNKDSVRGGRCLCRHPHVASTVGMGGWSSILLPETHSDYRSITSVPGVSVQALLKFVIRQLEDGKELTAQQEHAAKDGGVDVEWLRNWGK